MEKMEKIVVNCVAYRNDSVGFVLTSTCDPTYFQQFVNPDTPQARYER